MDLGSFGVLYFNGCAYLRGILVPHMPTELAGAAQQALASMIQAYLDTLRSGVLKQNFN